MFPDPDNDQPAGYDAVSTPSPGPFGRYASALGQGMLQGVAGQSPLGRGLYNAFSQPGPVKGESPKMHQLGNQAQTSALNSVVDGTPPGPAPQAVPPPVTGPQSGANNTGQGIQLPQTPQAVLGQQPPDQGASSQWGSSAPKSPLTGAALGALGLKGGALVTQPTLAKIGEKGPEAVVPLTPRAGNKLQPDLLEGRLKPPAVPGVRYSRYKSFSNTNPLR